MVPIDQTSFASAAKKGNCVQACVASILDLPLEDVPDFVTEYGYVWMEGLKEWLSLNHECSVIKILASDDGELRMTFPDGHFIMSGTTSRSNDVPGRTVTHSVVFKGDTGGYRMVHDPYPGGSGLEKVTSAIVFTRTF